MIDFKQIEAFVWVAELGGFRAAAEKLNTSQPAISQRIAGMESIMETRLFDRGARGIKLTEKGQELLSHAQRLLDMRRAMLKVAQAPHALRGTFRLGCTETLVHTWLPVLLERLHEQYPALVVEVNVETTHVLRGQLAAHHIDLALIVGPTHDPRCDDLPLCEYEQVWAASPSLRLHGRKLTVGEMGDYPIITYPSGSQPHQDIKNMLAQAGLRTPRLYASASLSTIKEMAKRGMGPCVVVTAVINEELKAGTLRALKVDQCPTPLAFYACWVRSSASHTPRTVARIAQQVASAQLAEI